MSWFWNKKEEIREGTDTVTLAELLGLITDDKIITTQQAMQIPALSSCIELICNTCVLPKLKLYEKAGKKTTELMDYRTTLFNVDTKDTLDATQFRKAIVRDYLLEGNGYSYINKKLNTVDSLNYVDSNSISVINNTVDPIFKSFSLTVNANEYRDFEFIKLLRNTKDGAKGVGIVEENQKILQVSYNSLIYENVLVKNGGNKKGFLKSDKVLTKEALEDLKSQWSQLYANNSNNMMILNKGLDFTEASATSVEMQLVENKKANTIEICKILNVPPAILEGNATKEEYKNFIKICILPILKVIENALNRNLLLESEKSNYYFEFDMNSLNKADIEERFKAHEMAIKNTIKTIDEVREEENLEPLNLEFIKLNLADVLYDIKTKQFYTPNTNESNSLDSKNVVKEVIKKDESGIKK
ncbi:phage portal protein [Clostridium sp. FP1]|uniref:phage portal protein n=1 Tax=Clostridium sp. FP1 TaxID=2724076 RepID=UPI0013E95095|nr:phage portal protein [Clostridium sp. FP1]MBZ9635506.1 phage portal protein [Clostridium sp. FP1]